VGAIRMLLALALTGAIVVAWTAYCRRLVGGQTGDLTGALQAMIEVTILGAMLID